MYNSIEDLKWPRYQTWLALKLVLIHKTFSIVNYRLIMIIINVRSRDHRIQTRVTLFVCGVLGAGYDKSVLPLANLFGELCDINRLLSMQKTSTAY